MNTNTTRGIIKDVFPAQQTDTLKIQRFLFTEPECLKPDGKLHSKMHTVSIQAINEGCDMLSGLKAGDEVEITCWVNGKQKVTLGGHTFWYNDLRLRSLNIIKKNNHKLEYYTRFH
jgi:hypothetical protein